MSDEASREELNVYVLPLDDSDKARVTESRREAIRHGYQVSCEGYQMLRIWVPIDKKVVFWRTPVTGSANPPLELVSSPE